MNTFVGNIRINSVSSSSNVQIGDAAFYVLSSNTKLNGGANSFSPGDSFGTLTNNQNNNTIDPDLIESNTNV
ncbi:spore gernimation protein GerPA [Paenibacillus ferrarius]|uniref:Spore gernimation protein GerPA n=1 Tax=Paenibacillus ferrarius TaxID=1469647 RepID=A0A1V4HRB0_9BACL|nr:spore germination protein [Paenibacillus ferrarius]OPH61234.1 spore gernimation protein GerPA [Paenibacillus ferrarius]